MANLDLQFENLWENFLHGCGQTQDGQYLGTWTAEKGYVFVSYEEVKESVLLLSGELSNRGFAVQDKIGIFSVNRPEWVFADLACFAANFVSVPMHETFDDDALAHIIVETEMKVIFTVRKNISRLEKLLEKIDSHSIQLVVVMDKLEHLCKITNKKLEVTSLLNIVLWGTANPLQDIDRVARRQHLATICYTSGTTGVPKGAMLTHGNILAELAALEYLGKAGKLFVPSADDVHLSYLPLAHIFERVIVHYMTRVGAQIGFYRGDVKYIMDDLQALKPTIFVTVPRLITRLYSGAMDAVAKKNFIIRRLFKCSYERKLTLIRQNRSPSDMPIIDAFLLKPFRKKLGGRVRAIVTGSAPLSGQSMDFLRAIFNAQVYEGYGQTETCSGITLTSKDELQTGHVGYPFPNCQIKLSSLPEMNYHTTDHPPRGEILVKGQQLFVGYYKNEEKTKQVYTEDGWYKTGDVGSWDARGRLIILDRVKCIFKLSQGEYVAPEKIERFITENCPFLENVFVTGNSTESYIIAIVVLRENGDSSLTEDQVVTKIEQVSKNRLKGFEIPKKVHIVKGGFPDTLLTPTFKVKRNDARSYYGEVIDDLYSSV